jgi:hypothetical protein
MRLKFLLLFSLLFFVSSIRADELPDKPGPRTVNKEFIIETAALATSWTLDSIATAQRYNWCNQRYGTVLGGYEQHCYEGGGFFDGTRDTAKIMAAWAAVGVGTVVLSYEWKKHIHNKWLHPLWRLPLLYEAGSHISGAAVNWSYPQPAAPIVVPSRRILGRNK